ncbi:MAG: hypothetical protein LCI00_33955 [Chloroflexi bacterium]|nr:hypothetical protein [Chloroflexota bacterium]
MMLLLQLLQHLSRNIYNILREQGEKLQLRNLVLFAAADGWFAVATFAA